MALLFRQATVEDAEVVHGIIQAAFAEYQGTVPVLPGALSDTLEEIRRIVAEGRTVLVFSGSINHAEFEGSFADSLEAGFSTAVGTVRYEVRPDYLYIGRLAVVPDYRRLGVGAAMMRHIEQLAPPLGRTRLRLGTRESMPGNLAFYERLGYRIVEREQHPRGPDVNVWFEKELEGVDTPGTLTREVEVEVAPLVGKVLEEVRYWCFDSDVADLRFMAKDLDIPFAYIGGEVELCFSNAAQLFINWRSNRGWGGAYSLSAMPQPHFSPGRLEPFNANSTGTWKPLVGSPLSAVDILGWDSVPYVLKLVFLCGVAYVGSGMQHGFGDGDDTLICSKAAWEAIDSEEPQVLAHMGKVAHTKEGRLFH